MITPPIYAINLLTQNYLFEQMADISFPAAASTPTEQHALNSLLVIWLILNKILDCENG